MSERERAGESEQGGEPGEQAGRQARKSELGSGSVVWPAAGEKNVLGSKPRFSILFLVVVVVLVVVGLVPKKHMWHSS